MWDKDHFSDVTFIIMDGWETHTVENTMGEVARGGTPAAAAAAAAVVVVVVDILIVVGCTSLSLSLCVCVCVCAVQPIIRHTTKILHSSTIAQDKPWVLITCLRRSR